MVGGKNQRSSRHYRRGYPADVFSHCKYVYRRYEPILQPFAIKFAPLSQNQLHDTWLVHFWLSQQSLLFQIPKIPMPKSITRLSDNYLVYVEMAHLRNHDGLYNLRDIGKARKMGRWIRNWHVGTWNHSLWLLFGALFAPLTSLCSCSPPHFLYLLVPDMLLREGCGSRWGLGVNEVSSGPLWLYRV